MATLSRLQFSARPQFEARVLGTQFQAQSNGQWQTVHTVSQTPVGLVTVTLPKALPNVTAVQAILPTGSFGNLATLKAFNGKTELTGTPFGPAGFHPVGGPGAVYTAVFDGREDTFFDSPVDEVITLGLQFAAPVAAVAPAPVVAPPVTPPYTIEGVGLDGKPIKLEVSSCTVSYTQAGMRSVNTFNRNL